MIWLLRHGEAADGAPDAERPLTEKGERQARNAGAALKRLGVKIDVCFTSPKVRAAETARLVCRELGVDYHLDERLAGEPFDPAELVAGFESVLLVGHDPGFSTAVHDQTGAQVRMKKGGLACIEPGEMHALLRPAELEAIAS